MAETNEATLATLACAFRCFPDSLLALWLKTQSMLHLQTLWGPTWTSFSTSSSSVRWKELAWRNIGRNGIQNHSKTLAHFWSVNLCLPKRQSRGCWGSDCSGVSLKNARTEPKSSHNGDIVWIRKSKNQQLRILAKKKQFSAIPANVSFVIFFLFIFCS